MMKTILNYSLSILLIFVSYTSHGAITYSAAKQHCLGKGYKAKTKKLDGCIYAKSYIDFQGSSGYRQAEASNVLSGFHSYKRKVDAAKRTSGDYYTLTAKDCDATKIARIRLETAYRVTKNSMQKMDKLTQQQNDAATSFATVAASVGKLGEASQEISKEKHTLELSTKKRKLMQNYIAELGRSNVVDKCKGQKKRIYKPKPKSTHKPQPRVFGPEGLIPLLPGIFEPRYDRHRPRHDRHRPRYDGRDHHGRDIRRGQPRRTVPSHKKATCGYKRMGPSMSGRVLKCICGNRIMPRSQWHKYCGPK